MKFRFLAVLMAALLAPACNGQGGGQGIPQPQQSSSAATLRVVDGLSVSRPTLAVATVMVNGQRFVPNERGEVMISNLAVGTIMEISAPGYLTLRTKWRNRSVGAIPAGEIALTNESTLPSSFIRELVYTTPSSIDCSEGRLKGKLVPLRRVAEGAHIMELQGEMATDPLSQQHSAETLEAISGSMNRVAFNASFTLGAGGKFRTRVDLPMSGGNAGVTYTEGDQYGFTTSADVYLASMTSARYGDVVSHEWLHVVGLGHHCQQGVMNPNRDTIFPELSEFEELALRYLAIRESKTRLVLDPAGVVVGEDDTDVAIAFTPTTTN